MKKSRLERRKEFSDRMRSGIPKESTLKSVYHAINLTELARNVFIKEHGSKELPKLIKPNYVNVEGVEYFNIDKSNLPEPDFISESGDKFYHCDDLSDSGCLPECVKNWVDHERMPAMEKFKATEEPKLFATNADGFRVRCVMASRFGDVGITNNLNASCGYTYRLGLTDLKDFSEKE
jgi:hypothetical protein